jgi:oligopeptidase B
MMRRLPLTLLLLAPLSWLLAQEPLPAPPVAKKVPKTDTIHGDTRVDNYFWLRQKDSPEVRQYLEAENAYTAAFMKPTKPLQEKLYQEMLGRIQQTDASVPAREGGYYYYSRQVEGKQYAIHCRKKGSLDAPEEIILDENELAKGKAYFAVAAFEVSDDGNLLAYSYDLTGFRQYTLRVKDLRTGQLLADRAAKVTSVAWAADNKTLFYTTENASKRSDRLIRHPLGRKHGDLVYEEKDELYDVAVGRTRDKEYLLVGAESKTTTEFRYLKSDQPHGAWQVVLPRQEGHEYHVSHRHGQWYLRTNKDARNFRLVTAPVATPGPDHWKDLIPARPDVLLEDVDLFENFCVASERSGALPHLRLIDLRSMDSKRITFGEPAYDVAVDANPEFRTNTLRFRYESPVNPPAVYDYDLTTGERTLRKQVKVLGGYDPSKYATERVIATAPDGVKVPISLVYRKDLKRDGGNPLLLYGYGAYGFTYPLGFSSKHLSLLDRGVIYAYAHIRGGSDMGRAWYDEGKMMRKRNTFTDFIACADHLVNTRVARREQLAIMGGSAGGLLIGAVLDLRPDLCKAAVLEVPFVDVINTMLDETLPLTSQEFIEWGNPKEKAAYDYMKSYCPYTNVKPTDYPAMLVMTSLNDSQVMYWEPAKYVAKLRATKTDHNPLILRVNMEAGHGGASGRYDALKEDAFIYAFLLTQLGIEKVGR